jgi:hypothetical protein
VRTDGGHLFLFVYRHGAAGLSVHDAFYHGPQSPGDLHIGEAADGQIAASFYHYPSVGKGPDIDLLQVR